jgi:cyclohexa-1,5-dienecarbonyl-CoA hydratase
VSDTIRATIDGPLARITIDRPPLNVLSTAMLVALREAFERACTDPSVRLVRFDAVGRVFSAGVDVGDHEGPGVVSMMDALTELFQALARPGPPTVSVVHGAALGGGCELALAMDLCYASRTASFAQPEIRLGLFAPPASVLLPRRIGFRRAMDLLLTGRSISAEEAERWGLVNGVFAEESLETEVSERLAALTALSGSALRQAKAAVLAAEDLDVVRAHAELRRIYLDGLMRTADAEEGLRAFLEKRQPVWKHR